MGVKRALISYFRSVPHDFVQVMDLRIVTDVVPMRQQVSFDFVPVVNFWYRSFILSKNFWQLPLRMPSISAERTLAKKVILPRLARAQSHKLLVREAKVAVIRLHLCVIDEVAAWVIE